MKLPAGRRRAWYALFAATTFLAAYAAAALLDGPGEAPFSRFGSTSGETFEFFGAAHAPVTLGLDDDARAGGFISGSNLAPGDVIRGHATIDTSLPIDAATHSFGFRAHVAIEGPAATLRLDDLLLVKALRYGGADVLQLLTPRLDADGDQRVSLRELSAGADGLAPPASRAAGGTAFELDLVVDPDLGGTGEALAGQRARVTFTFGLVETPHEAPPESPPPATIPGPPGGLFAEQVGQAIALSWSAPASDGGSPITGYRILRGFTASSLTPYAEVGPVLVFQDTSLQSGLTYFYQVAATNGVGTGAPSNVAPADYVLPAPTVTLHLTPPAPDGLEGWYLASPIVTLTSDLENATILVSIGGVEREYTEPFTLPDGDNALVYRAVRDGVESEPRTRIVKIDSAPPSIPSATVSSTAVGLGGSADVSATATDAGSGVADVKLVARGPTGASIEIPLTPAGPASFAGRFTPAEPGVFALAIVASDVAGLTHSTEAGSLLVRPASEPINLTGDPEPAGGPGPDSNPGPQSPTQEAVEEPEPAILFIPTNGSKPVGPDEGVGGEVIVRVANVKNIPRTFLVLIAPNGTEYVLARGEGETRWNTTQFENGYYRVETREQNEDGSTKTVASARVLVFNPRSSVLETAAAMATGFAAAMISSAAIGAAGGGTLGTLSSVASARVFDFFGFVREGAAAIGEDKLRDRTKYIGHRGKRSIANLRSLTAGIIAVVLFAAFFTWESVEGWDFDQYFSGLPFVGGAAVVFFAMAWSSEIFLAQLSGARTKFKLLISGTIALVFSSTLLRSAFGYAGFIEKDERGDDKAIAQRRLAAFRSMAVYGAVTATTVVFHYVGLWWNFQFAEAGIAIALTTLATSSMPFRPLPGQEVWAWNKAVAVVCCLGAFALYFTYNVALIEPSTVTLIGLVGAAFFAVAAFVVPRMGAALSPKGEESGETNAE